MTRMRLAAAVAVAFATGIALGWVAKPSPITTPSAGPTTTAVDAAAPSPTLAAAGLPTVRPTPTQTLPPAGPTQDPFRRIAPRRLPVALGAEPAAGNIVFTDSGATFLYIGDRGSLGVLSAGTNGSAVAVNPRVVWLRSAFDDEPLFDTVETRYLRLLPRESARFASASVSADGSTVAYLTPQGELRVAAQQPFGNVGGRAIATGRMFTSATLSPSARTIVTTAITPGADTTLRLVPGDLWIVDLESGDLREVTAAHGRALAPLSWSPDDAYLALWAPSAAAGVNALGRALFMLEVATGKLISLGNGFESLSQRSWAGPHTFAFTSVERPGIDSTRITVWTPTSGASVVTAADVIASSPSTVDGKRLYFIAATTSGPAHVRVLDLTTGATRLVQHDAEYTDLALRAATDGALLLVQRRRLVDSQVELVLVTDDGLTSRVVIRYSAVSPDDLSRFGSSYPIYPALLDGVAWSRS